MPSLARTLRPILGLTLCGVLFAASSIGGSSPAAAFGFGNFGRMGGFGGMRAGPGAGLRAGPHQQMFGPHRGAGRMADRPSRGGNAGNGNDRGSGRHPGAYVPDLPGPGVAVGGAGGNTVGGNNASGGGGGGGGGGGMPPRGESRFVLNEVITAFTPGATPQAIAQIARRYDLTQLESQSFPLLGSTLYRWRVGGRRTVGDAIGALEDERIVASVQPNYVFTLQDDVAKRSAQARGEASQYVLGKLQVEQAQQIATGKNVAVALIDSQIDAKNPGLDGAILKSFDALGGEANPQLHGTAMAGAIAAHATLLGIAPGAQLLAARAFGDGEASKGTSFAVYKGLQWAADNAARVVNMSFAGPADPALRRMLAAAYAKDMVLIAAAGNAGPNSAPPYPAADPNVIAVTATDNRDGLYDMANRGPYIAIAAPGVEILALAPSESYQITTGTSVAAAHVSGIVALLLECKPSLKPAEIRTIITATAQTFGAGARSDFGAGLANAYRAVTAIEAQPAKDAEQAKQ